MARFGRVLSAMVTPFDSDGALDLEAAKVLARYLQAHGNDGLVIAGTTGEAPTLNDDERLSLFAAVDRGRHDPCDRRNGNQRHTPLGASHARKPRRSVPRASSPSVRTTTARRRPASRPTCAAIAAASDLPVIVYDIPIRTGRKITTGDVAAAVPRGAQHRRPEGCRGEPGRDRGSDQLGAGRIRGVQRRRRDDAAAAGQRHRRHVGVATHWTGEDHQEMFDLWEKGDTDGARLVNSRMLESFAFETGDDAPNPIPTKAMMRHLGLAVGQARLPMGDAPEFVEQRAPEVWANLQRWRDAFPDRPAVTADG